MKASKRVLAVTTSLGVALIVFNAVYSTVTGFAAEGNNELRGDSSSIPTGKSDAEKPKSGKDGDAKYRKSDRLTAIEYAKQIEPDLGVPPQIDIGKGVEIPIYIDGVQATGSFHFSDCDNPDRAGQGCVSGSVMMRFEGKTADGTPLPHVVWVAFARHSGGNDPKNLRGSSVQMIGHNKESGATAFFESTNALEPWASREPETGRLLGIMPWIDKPEQFNQAYDPIPMQCVICHQNDPWVHNDFIDAAKMPGTDEPVVPVIVERSRNLEFDLPYYVIGGENWDMRTIHIEGNKCLDCHRIGMPTLEFFMASGWDPNDHMPPKNPDSLSEDFQALLECWENSPEETPGCDWVIPPAGDALGRVVGDDYPH